MQKIKDYLSNPGTRISICVFLFTVGGVYTSINLRLNHLEEFERSVDIVKLQTTLSSIQTDVAWIKKTIDKS